MVTVNRRDVCHLWGNAVHRNNSGWKRFSDLRGGALAEVILPSSTEGVKVTHCHVTNHLQA